MNRLFKQINTTRLVAFCLAGLMLAGCAMAPGNQQSSSQPSSGKPPTIRTWDMQEIVLHAQRAYDNYYTDVDVWVQLEGPGFDKRVYGFWDGDNRYVVRVVATGAGEWRWRSGANVPDDAGLNGHSGRFVAREWSDREKRENPVRRGFLSPTPNGRALQYADGTPFFMVGDTWLAGTTWRLPFRNAPTADNYQPGPGIGFEDAVMYRKRQGFNSVSMIAAFPNWEADRNPSTYADDQGVHGGRVESAERDAVLHPRVRALPPRKHLGQRRTRDQAACRTRMRQAYAQVIAVEQMVPASRHVVRPITQDEAAEEPGGMRQVPFGRAGIGHRLQLGVLGRQRRGQGKGACTHRGVAVDGDVRHAGSIGLGHRRARESRSRRKGFTPAVRSWPGKLEEPR